MIQELLASSLLGDPKFSFNGAPNHAFQTFNSPPPSSSPSSTAPQSAAASNVSTTKNPSENNNNNNKNKSLRCPRCDSANTKFCYYNNYNLTQPRHFCKTCRRYWTKGGALRNVPIGGGCRKNKTTIVTSKPTSNKLLNTISSSPDNILRPQGFENPNNTPNALWASSSPQSSSSHLLALLRSQNPNPNPNLSYSGTLVGNDMNSGLQEVYHRLIRSATTNNNYYSDHHEPVVLMSNAASSSSILDSAPVTAELGYAWNVKPAFSWSDHSTANNGAYPN